MPLPQRFHVRCFDPTRRWPGRLRTALKSALWQVIAVDSCEELLPEAIRSAGALPSQMSCPPALLLCVIDDVNEADVARWWSQNRERANPRSPLVVVGNAANDSSMAAYWQELGATAVLTTTLELPLVLQLAESFAAHPDNLSAIQEHPLTPFWQALPWSDALPKAEPAR